MANIRPLNAELRLVATEELNEVENRIPEDLKTLKEWLDKQPHLRARLDDQFLVAFLRGCKYSLEKTKSKLDYFYTIKGLLPEMLANKRVDEKHLVFGRSGAFLSLPRPLGAGGPRLHVTTYAKVDTTEYTLNDLFKFQCLFMDWKINNDDHYVVSGQIEIIDFSNMTLSFLAQFDLALIKKLAVFTEKAAPNRIKGVHIVNAPKEGQAILSMGRSFLSAKLQKRFYVHKNLEELHKTIPKEYLPEEYGGTNGTIPEILSQMEQHLKAFAAYYIEDDKYGVDEKLRPDKHVDRESLFGLDGTFRKLDID